MKNRTVKILLFVSFAFNIAFLGGGIYRFSQMRRFRPIHERINNERVRDFMEHRKEMGSSFLHEFHEAKDQFMSALAKPGVAENELNKLIDEVIEKQNLMEREIGESMIELRLELSDAEAEEVFGRFRKWMQPPDHFEHDKKGPKEKFRKFKKQ